MKRENSKLYVIYLSHRVVMEKLLRFDCEEQSLFVDVRFGKGILESFLVDWVTAIH
jgi:hypothetical protein